MLIGLSRVRNESLIIEDTLRHMLGYCDNVIIYDDDSDDDTVEKCLSVNRVTVLKGTPWSLNRQLEETRHRAILLDFAKEAGAEWCLYMDADERLIGGLPDMTHDAYRFQLFDGYMTPDHRLEYTSGHLQDLPRLYGPERRDITMLFRADKSRYLGLDQREPVVEGHVERAQVFVQHFGKCLSVDHWEETCDYYATFFPEPYRSKWEGRKGKAIHTASDFGRPLYGFGELLADSRLHVRI